MQARCHESVVAAVYIHISKRVFVFVCTKRGPKVMKELFKSSYILVLESFVFFGQCVLPKRVGNVQINVFICIFLRDCCRAFAHVYRNTF